MAITATDASIRTRRPPGEDIPAAPRAAFPSVKPLEDAGSRRQLAAIGGNMKRGKTASSWRAWMPSASHAPRWPIGKSVAIADGHRLQAERAAGRLKSHSLGRTLRQVLLARGTLPVTPSPRPLASPILLTDTPPRRTVRWGAAIRQAS